MSRARWENRAVVFTMRWPRKSPIIGGLSPTDRPFRVATSASDRHCPAPMSIIYPHFYAATNRRSRSRVTDGSSVLFEHALPDGTQVTTCSAKVRSFARTFLADCAERWPSLPTYPRHRRPMELV